MGIADLCTSIIKNTAKKASFLGQAVSNRVETVIVCVAECVIHTFIVTVQRYENRI